MHMHIYIPEGKKKKARYGESGGDGKWTAESSKYQGTKVSEKKGGWKNGRSHEKRIVQTNLWLLGQIVSSGSGVPKMERT